MRGRGVGCPAARAEAGASRGPRDYQITLWRGIFSAMKPGRASQTAVLVCMGRAAAHGRSSARAFSDPTALALLPEEARARVERFRAAGVPRRIRDRVAHSVFDHRSKMMV